MSNFAQKLFLDRLNSVSGLFVDESDLDYYGRLILKLKGLIEASHYEQNALLAYILLFYSYDTKRSKDLEKMFSSVFKTRGNELTLTNLVATLTKMACFCRDNIIWNEIDC